MSNNLAAAYETVANFTMDYNFLDQFQRAMTPEPLSLMRAIDNAPSSMGNFGSGTLRPVKHRSRNRKQKKTATSMVWCNYCRNQMPESSLQNHLDRKHTLVVDAAENRGPKRGHTDQMLQQNPKRHRLNSNPPIENGSLTPPFDVMRPETPPMPLAPDQPSTFVQIEGMPYNLVYVSDGELNRLMGNGLIRVHEGHLFMKETEQDTSDLDTSVQFTDEEIEQL